MEILFLILVLIFSVVIHEVAHGYMAYYLGDPTAKLQGRLTLNPIPHLDPIGSIIVPAALAILPGGIIFGWAKPVPYNPHNISHPRGDALVAAVGPASNIALALIAGVVVQFLVPAGALAGFLYMVILINIVLAIFNLVPIPPLDGSKILFSFLPPQFESLRVNLERYGFVFLLIFVFFLFHLITPFIAFAFEVFAGVPLYEIGI